MQVQICALLCSARRSPPRSSAVLLPSRCILVVFILAGAWRPRHPSTCRCVVSRSSTPLSTTVLASPTASCSAASLHHFSLLLLCSPLLFACVSFLPRPSSPVCCVPSASIAVCIGAGSQLRLSESSTARSRWARERDDQRTRGKRRAGAPAAHEHRSEGRTNRCDLARICLSCVVVGPCGAALSSVHLCSR